jgi:NADH:ubiquinone oxidoreductase subunit C
VTPGKLRRASVEEEAYGETTVVVARERLLDAALHLRDVEGFNFLADVTSADFLGWDEHRVAGYWGSAIGRDTNVPGSSGMAKLPGPKPKRFGVAYHLLALRRDPKRLRLRVWVDDGEPVASVVGIWPTADWQSARCSVMGIPFEGHPTVRILMSEDGSTRPQDYPWREPVRFGRRNNSSIAPRPDLRGDASMPIRRC